MTSVPDLVVVKPPAFGKGATIAEHAIVVEAHVGSAHTKIPSHALLGPVPPLPNFP